MRQPRSEDFTADPTIFCVNLVLYKEEENELETGRLFPAVAVDTVEKHCAAFSLCSNIYWYEVGIYENSALLSVSSVFLFCTK